MIGMKEKYMRTYGMQYSLNSSNQKELMEFFCQKCRQHGINYDNCEIFEYLSRFEEKQTHRQLSLFE